MRSGLLAVRNPCRNLKLVVLTIRTRFLQGDGHTATGGLCLRSFFYPRRTYMMSMVAYQVNASSVGDLRQLDSNGTLFSTTTSIQVEDNVNIERGY